MFVILHWFVCFVFFGLGLGVLICLDVGLFWFGFGADGLFNLFSCVVDVVSWFVVL